MLPDLPLPAPKRFKRSAPEPEEPPSVQEVPKAELSGRMDEIMGKMEGEMRTMNEDGDIVPTLSYPSYYEFPFLEPLVLDGFSIGSILFVVSYGGVFDIRGKDYTPSDTFRDCMR